jgi:2-oxoisovalerate dehydrogenase E1 component
MRGNPEPIKYDRSKYSDEVLIDLYHKLIYPRLIEEKMLILLRQGKISKWFSGIGQEAISVGVGAALLEDEFIFTLHRNLGVFTSRNVPFQRLFSQWQGKANGFSKGRERSFHFGTMEHHIVGMISHLGPQLSLANGVALAHLLKNEGKVSLAFSGEGGTSEGEFHEALNVAAVWNLPVIFLIENNGYGLSTPINQQFKCERISDKGIGYGMKSITINGNNILEVYDTISSLAAAMREDPHPVLLECMTFRMRGHEEASGTKYVPKDLLDQWALRDPISNYERFLIEESILSEEALVDIQKEYKKSIDLDLKLIYDEPDVIPSLDAEMKDVYFPYTHSGEEVSREEGISMRYVDAVSNGLDMAMQKHENLILMGQDIADYGGVFKITDGFTEKFGRARVRNTPLCESAIIGAGLGLSLKGYKSMIEMQFADFVTCGFNQIVNNLAKIHYRWGEKADVVIRMPTGAGVGAGPFHSQSNEAWFTHVPGLKVVYPSTPYDAKGLLLASFDDPNPVLYFEHKAMYRGVAGIVPQEYYTVPIGKAYLSQEGSDFSIITYGMGVHWAKNLKDEFDGSTYDVLDLRSLLPLDYEAIDKTVKKTGKVIVLHEDTLFGGIGAEISAYISEHLFSYLDAPVMRCAGLNTPIPFAIPLENQFLASSRLKNVIQQLIEY